MLDANTFLHVVSATPLVAIDLVLLRAPGEVLLGLRNNRPAQGFWFVPGGRIRKNETIRAAMARITAAELGLPLADLPGAPRPIGHFEHFYPDSFAGSAEEIGVSTHYVVLAYALTVPADFQAPHADSQHAELRWWSLHEARTAAAVHPLSQAYLAAERLACA
ncbi:DUF4916 domain-containing protein [Rhodocyclus tenuis]|uniref:DUF4916 domain-containing protein n=1 Tax=Rhodocyclus gracilis TaxID=2929842 RepID=A0ABX0WGA4_9RHOO|nr:DUF4916 domain-containing protein [Rhodocyclus gracilis]NJA88750.1 DUF4916 domain-containing protein [Rhodocyclus gracilis]